MFADNYPAGGSKGPARFFGGLCDVPALVFHPAARGRAMERDLSSYCSGMTV